MAVSISISFLLLLLLHHLISTSSSDAVRTQFEAELKKVVDGDKAPYVGVNIGTDISAPLSTADLTTFLQLQKITHVRIYDADPDILNSLAGTKIRVVIGLPNNQLLGIGSSNSTAAAWITRNVVAYYP